MDNPTPKFRDLTPPERWQRFLEKWAALGRVPADWVVQTNVEAGTRELLEPVKP